VIFRGKRKNEDSSDLLATVFRKLEEYQKEIKKVEKDKPSCPPPLTPYYDMELKKWICYDFQKLEKEMKTHSNPFDLFEDILKDIEELEKQIKENDKASKT